MKAHTKSGDHWSALREFFFVRPIAKSALQISEIQYHTYGDQTGGRKTPAERFEFVEIRNQSDRTIALTGVALTEGVCFQFPNGAVIKSGGHVAVAADPKAFNRRYGFRPVGKYLRSLSNSGETVTLSDVIGNKIDSVTYLDKDPWPSEADGSGRTLSRANSKLSAEAGGVSEWSVSPQKDGTPGRKNTF